MGVTAGPYEAVIFDFHGVITTPPLAGVEAYELELGVPAGSLTRYMRGHPLVHQLERNEVDPRDYWRFVRADVRGTLGLEIDLRRLVAEMDDAIALDEEMLDLVAALRPHYRTAMLTNVGKRSSRVFHGEAFRDRFDVVVESAAVGLRKPDPAIYELVARDLGVAPTAAVFVDDWEENLPPAAALGMATVAYTDAAHCEAALRDLGLVW